MGFSPLCNVFNAVTVLTLGGLTIRVNYSNLLDVLYRKIRF